MNKDSSSDTQKNNKYRYLTPIAVVISVIIIGGALYFGHGSAVAPSSSPNTPQTSATAPIVVNIKNIKINGNPYIGSKSAPVVMALWFDYQCTFCKILDENTVSKLYTNYVQTGKLRIVFKDFSFLGSDSNTAALFARAVWALYPDKFYAWNHSMFNSQDGENTGFGNLASIEKLTKTISGIDVARVVALMNKKSNEFRADISNDRTQGEAFGINGTPSFVIGTHLYQGALSYDAVSTAIDTQLKKVQ